MNNSVPPGSINPDREQFDAFKNLPRDTPILMLNLVRFRERAAYDDDRDVSGRDAYAVYGRESAAIFRRVGGTIAWRGKPEVVLIGPQTEHWDVAFSAHYPSAAAFLEMVTDPAYREAVIHRQAGVRDSRLIRMAPTEEGDIFSD